MEVRKIFIFLLRSGDFKNLIYTNHVYIVNLDINGKFILAIMKEIQFHPVSDELNPYRFC